MKPIVLVHGGAGNVRDARVPAKIASVKIAATKAYEVLERGGTALDAVEEAVRIMEDDECMNSGYGSLLNSDGVVEMDASIMNGANMGAGAVAAVRDIAHPITLARMVMEKTPHVMISGDGAVNFAKANGMEMLEPGALVTQDALKALEIYRQTGTASFEVGEAEAVGEVGTVGAVALDINGHVAAATSTGGMNGKHPGRIGDTPIIGAGTYARDDVGAVSTTGHGETITKWCLAHSIIKEMERGANPQTAIEASLNQMDDKLKEKAGVICISKQGKIGVGMTTRRMAWAYRKGDELVFGMEKGEQKTENIPPGSNSCSMG